MRGKWRNQVYLDYYNLREPPFNLTPDPRFLFFSAKHQEAFNHLLFGIRERKGFIELTGEVGAGKTTVCRKLLEELGPNYTSALILNPCLSPTQLLRAISGELGLARRNVDRLSCLDALNAFVLEQASVGNDVVVVIDEAQNLSSESLEQIRLLSNLETTDRKLIQIVLMGQPELKTKLLRPDLRQLRQRITLRYHLQPLDLIETADYVKHRLRLAGASGRPRFDGGAITLLYKYSAGVPRVINAICDKALLAGFVHYTDMITAELLQLAVDELNGVVCV
jgi:general secretion pathway protein A